MPLPLFKPEPSSPVSSDTAYSPPRAAFGCPLPPQSFRGSTFFFLQGINVYHVAYKTIVYIWLAGIFWLAWSLSPFSGAWSRPQRLGKISLHPSNIASYFDSFAGVSDCRLNARDLYRLPVAIVGENFPNGGFCTTRAALLEAMSGGGRRGVDAPYYPNGCHHRWFEVAEICMILERFDGVVFLGDQTLQTLYNGLNILLRQDLAHGALKQWELTDEELKGCNCDNQFIRESCASHFVASSREVAENAASTKQKSTYVCQRTPHAILRLDSHIIPPDMLAAFNGLVPKAPQAVYKPIPIVFSLTQSRSTAMAAKVLDELLIHADATKRKTPLLWVGPTAPGHLEMKDHNENKDVWRFHTEMEQVARDRDVEALGLWNMTVQANSFNGRAFGENVAIVQAMMVINWLSRLETS